MTELRDKMIREMELRNFAPRTQHSYLNAVTGLTKHYMRSPDTINRKEVETYLLYLKKERDLSWNTCNVVISGLKFFYNVALEDKSISLVTPPKKSLTKLPVVLCQEDVWKIINAANHLKHRLLLMTIYSAGLRVSEAVSLKPEHIESDRMMIRVEQGKGNKDRYTLLSKMLLDELRYYWKTFRPKQWLFLAKNEKLPMSVGTAQKIYYNTKKKAGVKKGRGIHTLRHCFATHLLEAGYDIRKIQLLMGHKSLSTTMIYLHITRKEFAKLSSPLDLLKINHEIKSPWEEDDDTDK